MNSKEMMLTLVHANFDCLSDECVTAQNKNAILVALKRRLFYSRISDALY
jgi:hypothetical protein